MLHNLVLEAIFSFEYGGYLALPEPSQYPLPRRTVLFVAFLLSPLWLCCWVAEGVFDCSASLPHAVGNLAPHPCGRKTHQKINRNPRRLRMSCGNHLARRVHKSHTPHPSIQQQLGKSLLLNVWAKSDISIL